MEGKICMFTGHRTINARHLTSLSENIGELMERLIAEGYTDFRAGGAMGFDTLAAFAVLEKKKKYGYVKLHLYLPCHGQEKGWPENMKRAYYYVISSADSVRYAYDTYVNGCMHKRNRDMVNGSDLCVAYCGSDKGGTAYTVDYAKKKGIEVINLFESVRAAQNI